MRELTGQIIYTQAVDETTIFFNYQPWFIQVDNPET